MCIYNLLVLLFKYIIATNSYTDKCYGKVQRIFCVYSFDHSEINIYSKPVCQKEKAAVVCKCIQMSDDEELMLQVITMPSSSLMHQ